jgi:hypothetical protein
MTEIATPRSFVAQPFLAVLLGSLAFVEVASRPVRRRRVDRLLAFSVSVIPTAAARVFSSRRSPARRAAQWRDRGYTATQEFSMEHLRFLSLAWRTL